MKNTKWILYFSIFLIIGSVFFQVVKFDFVNLDDTTMIQKHPGLKTFDLATIWGTSHLVMYTPVTYTALGVAALLSSKTPLFNEPNLFITDLDPFVFHFMSLLIHILNTILVFKLLTRFEISNIFAFVGSLLFGLHPLQIESVAWIASTRELLMALFSLSSILYFHDHWISKKISMKSFVILTLLVSAAMLSKPTAIVIPLLFLIWFLFIEKRDWTSTFFLLSPLLMFACVLIISIKSLQSDSSLPFQVSLFERPVVALDALTFYIQKLFLPINLSVDYGRNPVYLFQSSEKYWTWIPSLSFIGMMIWLWKKGANNYKILMLIMILPFIPVSGLQSFTFQNVSTVADRYFYLPLAGAVGLFLLFLNNFNLKFKSFSKAVHFACFIVIALLSYLTFSQLGQWKNSDSLWTQVTKVNPQSWLAYNNWGSFYEAQHQFEKSIPLYKQSLAIRPDSLTWTRVGIMQYELKLKKEAFESFQKALQLNPSNPVAKQNYEVLSNELRFISSTSNDIENSK